MVQSPDSPVNNPSSPSADPQVALNDLIPVAEYAARNQTAVLVILFTDLKGSTELAEEQGEDFATELRRKHDELLRPIFERDGRGQLIKTIGDSLMYVFAKPSEAVARSIEVQRKLREYNMTRPAKEHLNVRIGMHMGQVLVQKDVDIDVFGRHVNRAARVESLADAGQILVTHSVYDSARGWLTGDVVSWHDHEEYHLKGIAEPTRIVEACSNGIKPKRPKGRRACKSRHWMFTTAAVIALAMLGAYFFIPWTRPLPKIDVSVRRGDSTVLAIAKSAPLTSGDEIRVRGEFHKPVFAAILFLDEHGNVEILKTSGDKQVTSLTIPEDIDGWVRVKGSAGTEMLVALEGTKPILNPPEVLMNKKWLLPKTPTTDETWWVSPDSIKIAHQGQTVTEKGLEVNEVQHHETHDLRFQIDELRRILKDQSYRFQAVAYPHR